MPYTLIPTALPEVLILEPKVFGDARAEFVNDFETPGCINLVCNRVVFC